MARRDRLPADSFPPWDGAIVLAPGAVLFLHVEHPPSPTEAELKFNANRYRGAILADAFQVEEQLLKLALANMFGSNDAGAAGPEYRDREDNWRRENSLGRKIERAKPIVRKHLPRKAADVLLHDLATFGRLRNLFAHYPFWMAPVSDEKTHLTISFTAYIADNDHVFTLDDDQAREWGELIHSVRVGVENIVRQLVGAPALNADGSAPPSSLGGGEQDRGSV
jgi:hypothetical protein